MSGSYDYNGGLALRGPAGCPTGTTQCSEGLEDRCCNDNQVCFTNDEGANYGNTSYCCPDSDDCIGAIQQYAKCGDPSWELCYSTFDDTGWCCQGDYPVCFTASGPAGGVGCAAATQDLSSNDVVVSTVYPVGQTFPTAASSTSTSLATTPITSSEGLPASSTSTSLTTAPTTSSGGLLASSTGLYPPSTTSLSLTTSTTSIAAASGTGSATSGGYDESDKIALGTGIGFGLPTTILGIMALVFKLRRR